jgi:hypothetical protein
MNRRAVITAALMGMAVGVVIGFVAGWRHRQFDLALWENKVAAGNLRANRDFFGSTNLPPVFQEYLKARIYCNIRNYYPSKQGYLLNEEWDFGPVDRKVLGSVGVWKDPDEKVWDWDSAVKDK